MEHNHNQQKIIFLCGLSKIDHVRILAQIGVRKSATPYLKKTWFVRSTHHKRMRPNLTARQSVGAGNDTRPPWFWSVSLTETQVDIYSCSDGFLYYLIVLGTYFVGSEIVHLYLFGNIVIRHDTGVFNQKSSEPLVCSSSSCDVVYPDVFHRWRSMYPIYCRGSILPCA